MERTIGISVYPEHVPFDVTVAYLEKAAKLGFKKLFLSTFVVVKINTKAMWDRYIKTIKIAHELGFYIIADIGNRILPLIGGNKANIWIKKMHINCVRIDDKMPTNILVKFLNENIDVQLNPSMNDNAIPLLLNATNKVKQISSLHNFYPQKYTALSITHFNEFNKLVKSFQLRNGAFVTSLYGKYSSREESTMQAVTLEIHRN